jgi:hypothetical protein
MKQLYNYADVFVSQHPRNTSIYLSIYLSMALQPFVGCWPLFTQSVGLLGWGISPLQGCCLHVGQHIHVSSGIRTHNPSVWAGEDSSCLRPCSHCDQPPIQLPARGAKAAWEQMQLHRKMHNIYSNDFQIMIHIMWKPVLFSKLWQKYSTNWFTSSPLLLQQFNANTPSQTDQLIPVSIKLHDDFRLKTDLHILLVSSQLVVNSLIF